MKLLVLIDDYPSETNQYSNVFAHVRVKGYIARGAQVQVCITSPYKSVNDFEFEGVTVFGSAKIEQIKNKINQFQPDAILVHFALGRLIKSVLLKNTTIPTVVWVHGYEALGWYRRLFNFHVFKPKSYFKLASLIVRNTIQLIQFRRLINHSNQHHNYSFVFVSEWMKNIAAQDCLIKIQRFEIIGNPIDNSLFSYNQKTAEDRFKLLMIRPFNSKKYATDLVSDTLIQLKKNSPELFQKLHITVYGKGSKRSNLFYSLGQESNVFIHDSFLKQTDIKKEHDKHGVFLALSRQDAQGVSMCEAMSSGLVVISSNNTAIPEYVPHNIAGILTNNQVNIIEFELKRLLQDEQLFLSLSESGSQYIQEKVGFNQIIEREVSLIKELIQNK